MQSIEGTVVDFLELENLNKEEEYLKEVWDTNANNYTSRYENAERVKRLNRRKRAWDTLRDLSSTVQQSVDYFTGIDESLEGMLFEHCMGYFPTDSSTTTFTETVAVPPEKALTRRIGVLHRTIAFYHSCKSHGIDADTGSLFALPAFSL